MRTLKICLIIIVFLGGIAIGFFIKKIPIIEFNREMKIYEVFNLLLTIGIGIFIPFFIKRWIDDRRYIKNDLIEELKRVLDETNRIKEKITFCYLRKSITPDDKDELNYLFEQSDIKVNTLVSLFETSYKSTTKELVTVLKDSYLKYWKSITGGELMKSTFVNVTEDFMYRHNESFLGFEVIVKQSICKVHRL